MLYFEEQLKKYSIYQLRFLARNVGVRAPTTKKREELIEKILAIQDGTEQPYYPDNVKGRPAKGCFMPLEKSETAIVYGVENDLDSDVVFKKRVTEYEGGNTAHVTGFVLERNKQYFLISFDNPLTVQCVASISKDFVNAFGLREGDKLVCGAKFDADKGILVVQNISMLNDFEYDGKDRPQFDEKAASFEKSKIDFDGDLPVALGVKEKAPICFGDRGLIVGNKRSRLYSIVLPIFANMGKNAKVVVLSLNETPERIDEIKREGKGKFEYFYSSFSDARNRQFYVLKMAVNYVKRLAERGDDVVFVITDLADVYHGELDVEELYSLKSFFAMAREFADGGSCTVVGGCSPEFFAEHPDFDDFANFVWVEEDRKFCKEKTIRHEK